MSKEKKSNKMQEFPACRGWLSLKEVEAYTGAGKDAVRSWRDMGLKWARIGGLVRVKKSEVDAFLESYYDREMADIDAIVEKLKV